MINVNIRIYFFSNQNIILMPFKKIIYLRSRDGKRAGEKERGARADPSAESHSSCPQQPGLGLGWVRAELRLDLGWDWAGTGPGWGWGQDWAKTGPGWGWGQDWAGAREELGLGRDWVRTGPGRSWGWAGSELGLELGLGQNWAGRSWVRMELGLGREPGSQSRYSLWQGEEEQSCCDI